MNKLLIALPALLLTIACNHAMAPDSGWADQRWTVIEMRGVPVQLSGTNRDAYIVFTPGEKRFGGNGGCNHISGNYTIDKKNIRFGEVISTKMACADINFETTFLSTLDKVNHFEQKDNTTMLLKDGNEVLLILHRRG